MDYDEDILPSTVLHWNYRGFTEFPLQEIRGEESVITDVYLKENLISRLPSEIGLLERLESLYISGNDITELPKEISKLGCLKCLDVSGNRLRRIPDEIGEMRSLKFLILDENELCELPLRIGELRYLRYLSVCDNKLHWLPQKPVYNYHHCEFRFWRNTNLRTLPYSLWYHMFRNQQTRSLNIGCLTISNSHHTLSKRGCRLKLSQESKEWDLCVEFPPQYTSILDSESCSPPSLYELSKRAFYQIICDAAKRMSTEPYSIYSDNVLEHSYGNNNNLQDNFEAFNINNAENVIGCDMNGNKYRSELQILDDNKKTKKRSKSNYVPADLIADYYDLIPSFVKIDLCNGPISRCENMNCKRPVFDYVFYEFCFGTITLIDSTEDVVLSATFCSKSCANLWKSGKNTIPWSHYTR